MTQQQKARGYTLIELLMFIAIVGIIAAIIVAVAAPSRNKAQDARIRSNIAQLRWEAEIAFDSQGASFSDWASHHAVVGNVTIILNDITEALGGTDSTVIRDSDHATYCVSAPLRTTPGHHYCIDADGRFQEVESPCPVSPPFACPVS